MSELVRWGEPIVRYGTLAADLPRVALDVLKSYGLLPRDVPVTPSILKSEEEIETFYEVVCWLIVRRRFEPVDVRMIAVYARALALHNTLMGAAVNEEGIINADAIKLAMSVSAAVKMSASALGIGPNPRARWLIKINQPKDDPFDTETRNEPTVWDGIMARDGRRVQS